MKKYTKPALMTLSISANDMLCSGCGANPIKGTWVGDTLLEWGFDRNGDGKVEWNDFGANAFGTSEACEEPPFGLENYCKHTMNDTIFWS